MVEFLDLIKAFTPGAVGVWTGVAMFAIYLLREWRENRKLTAEDRLARRDGYAKQIEMLMHENRALMADQAALRRELEENRKQCDIENGKLRAAIEELQSEVAELRKKSLHDEIQIEQLKLRGENHA